MEIKITGTPKEIADLVKSLQSQPVINSTISIDRKEISETISDAIGVGSSAHRTLPIAR